MTDIMCMKGKFVYQMVRICLSDVADIGLQQSDVSCLILHMCKGSVCHNVED